MKEIVEKQKLYINQSIWIKFNLWILFKNLNFSCLK